MTKAELLGLIKKKSSFLCVGLDPSMDKLPYHLRHEKDPFFEFNKIIIDHTVNHAVAYKPNLAFYEALGPKGMESLEKTLEYIPKEVFTIADAKRGDIGNTSRLYAKAFFQNMDFDAVTVSPYMGEDSVMPFLGFQDKWVILLALTSNFGSMDFQLLKSEDGKCFFETVLEKSQKWGNSDNMMYVVGATKGEKITEVRKIVPHHFLLVPGVGAQGGSLEEVAKHGMTKECGLLVNSSRGIIYASGDKDFGWAAKQEASKMHGSMKDLLEKYCL